MSVYTDLESSPKDIVTWKKASYKMCAPVSVKNWKQTHIYDYLGIDHF